MVSQDIITRGWGVIFYSSNVQLGLLSYRSIPYNMLFYPTRATHISCPKVACATILVGRFASQNVPFTTKRYAGAEVRARAVRMHVVTEQHRGNVPHLWGVLSLANIITRPSKGHPPNKRRTRPQKPIDLDKQGALYTYAVCSLGYTPVGIELYVCLWSPSNTP